jgi:hypothetical protein
MPSLWNHLGFQQNPYFATPIDISSEGCDLFVGRGEEVRRLINKWDERAGCVTIIGGNIGTGKTSFLNVCQYLCLSGRRQFGLAYDPPRLLPAFDKVQVEPATGDRDLLTRILWAATRSVGEACERLDLDKPPSCTNLSHWLGTTVSSESHGSSGGMTIAGTGFQAGSTSASTVRAPADVTVEVLASKLALLAREVSELEPYRGIVVALDNIELVDSEDLVRLLNRYRDTLFATANVWWVLIGQRGLFDLIDAESPRVAQRIKGTETTLEGLSWDDFHLAVSARIEHFRTRPDAIGPLGEQLLRLLFDASAGEIRYVFKMADQIVSDAVAREPMLTNVAPDLAETMLTESVRQQVARLGLGARDARILREISERGAVRPKDYKELGFQNAPNFLQSALQPLQEKGLIGKSTQGNAAVYSLRPLAILGLRFDCLRPV